MREKWAKLKRWQQWTAIGVAVLIVFGIIGAIAGGGDDEPTAARSAGDSQQVVDATTRQAPATTAPTQPTAAERAAAQRAARQEAAREKRRAAARARARARERAREKARRERLLRGTLVEGSGARVVNVNLTDTGPVIVESSHNGGSNYVLRLVGNGLEELLVNEIGSYSGSVAVDDAAPGRYRLSVEADGSWSIRYRQPRPLGGEPALLRTFKGSGPEVIQVRAPEDLQPIITASNSGSSNFVVRLIAYGDEVSGAELLFNEIGPYDGQTITNVPSGDYLLAVEAEGSWSVRFQR